VEACGKEVPQREPVARRDEGDARCGKGRRHEAEPFLVARGPAAAVPEEQHAPVRLLRLEDGEALIGIGAVALLAERNAFAALPAFGAIGLTRFRQRLLRRIVGELHARFSSASSTRSGVIGSSRRRAPVALQMALAMAGATP